jgi:perosamine synthetase
VNQAPFIPVSEPSLGALEREALIRCIDSGWISSEGPEVVRFEEEMAAYTGRRHGIAVSSGTAALDVAVAALDIGPGDEVIVPTFTIISCVLQVVRSGATPVFVDVDPLTWNVDVAAVAERITSRTRAMIIPHIYGLPADIEPLVALAELHGLEIIEDAAEAHGLRYRGRPCGSFGALSTFSFYPNKLITTGEGGNDRHR